MVKYIYNGVKLPFLPEVDGYDYKVLVEFNDAGTYVLYCMTSPLMRTGEVLYPNKLTAPYMSCTASVDGYGEFSQGTSDLKLAALYVPIWSNHDIYTTDGTLYLAATDPLPVGKPITDPLTYMAGYNWMKAMMAKRAGKKPIGYLYNGVQLPKIPGVEYPYMVIYQKVAFTDGYVIAASSTPSVYDAATTNVVMSAPMLKTTTAITEGSTDWGDLTEDTDGNTIYASQEILWTNHDIYKGDTVWKEKSADPVPVYEWGGMNGYYRYYTFKKSEQKW